MTGKLGLLFAAGLCACAVQAAGLTAANYVQDGLVTCFDGVDNAGTGTHDPSARVWKDLKGTGTASLVSGAVVGPRHIYIPSTQNLTGLAGNLYNHDMATELAVDVVKIGGDGQTTRWPFLFAADRWAAHGVGDASRVFRMYLNNAEPRFNSGNLYTNTISFVAEPNARRIYMGGAQNSMISTTTPVQGPISTSWRLCDPNHGVLRVKFFSLRNYDHAITADEAAHNAVVDNLRFWAPRAEGTGASVAWGDLAWTAEDGTALPAPGTATNTCAVVARAAVSVAAADKVGLLGLSLEDGATLAVADDAVVAAKMLFVEGQEIPHGIYTGEGGSVGTVVPWIAGAGQVRVAGGRNHAIPSAIAMPAADGWYEFGMASGYVYDAWGKGYTPSPSTGYHNFTADFPKWDDLAFPAGAKLRLVGGIILDTVPAERFSEIDCTELKYIAFNTPTAFSDRRPFVVPSGCTARYQDSWKWDEGTGKWWVITTGNRSGTFANPLEINGTWCVNGDNSHITYCMLSGAVSGTGLIQTSSFSNQIRFMNETFGFGGTLKMWSNGCMCWIEASRITNTVNLVQLHGTADQAQFRNDANYCASGLFFGPRSGQPAAQDELRIRTLEGNASVFLDTATGKRWQNGGVVCVWGGNTVHAETLKTPAHVMANRTDQNCVNGWFNQAVCFGTGAFVADAVAAGCANLFLSTNVYVTVGNVAGATCFDYTLRGNHYNAMTLDITNGCAPSASVKATDLGMLPARLSGFAGSVTLTETAAKSYEIPVDIYSGAAGLYQTVGCNGSGTLVAAPASGAIDAQFDVGGDAKPVEGQYALARFTSGGEKLADWTVTLNGAAVPSVNVRGISVRTMKDATGLWLKVTKSGCAVVIR